MVLLPPVPARSRALSLVAPGKITLFFVVMLTIQALVGIVAQPHFMGVCAAGKTEWEGRVGLVGGNLIKRICTAAWSLTAIAAVAWYIQNGKDPASLGPMELKQTADGIYGEIANTFLPRISPGLLGLFLAALLAGVMSSCDSFMIASSGLFSRLLLVSSNSAWSALSSLVALCLEASSFSASAKAAALKR